MTPRARVEAILRGGPADKVPFTIYESKIPQCSIERQLRHDGLCIVNRRHLVVSGGSPNVTSETHSYVEAGTRYDRTVYKTPMGELSTLPFRQASPRGVRSGSSSGRRTTRCCVSWPGTGSSGRTTRAC